MDMDGTFFLPFPASLLRDCSQPQPPLPLRKLALNYYGRVWLDFGAGDVSPVDWLPELRKVRGLACCWWATGLRKRVSCQLLAGVGWSLLKLRHCVSELNAVTKHACPLQMALFDVELMPPPPGGQRWPQQALPHLTDFSLIDSTTDAFDEARDGWLPPSLTAVVLSEAYLSRLPPPLTKLKHLRRQEGRRVAHGCAAGGRCTDVGVLSDALQQ